MHRNLRVAAIFKYMKRMLDTQGCNFAVPSMQIRLKPARLALFMIVVYSM